MSVKETYKMLGQHSPRLRRCFKAHHCLRGSLLGAYSVGLLELILSFFFATLPRPTSVLCQRLQCPDSATSVKTGTTASPVVVETTSVSGLDMVPCGVPNPLAYHKCAASTSMDLWRGPIVKKGQGHMTESVASSRGILYARRGCRSYQPVCSNATSSSV
jgi:hypothetical protein